MKLFKLKSCDYSYKYHFKITNFNLKNVTIEIENL